jgi:hypothetical protein
LQCAPAAADHDHDSLALPPLLEPPARVSTSAAVDIDADVGPVSSSLLLLLLLLLLKPFLTPMLATQRCLRSPARRPGYLFTRDRYDIQFASATPLCLLGYVCDGLSNIARNRDSVSTSALLLCCFLFYFARSAAMARNQNQTTKATISRPACLPVSTARLATFVSQCLACTIAFAKRRLRLLFNLASHLHAVSHEFVFAKYNNNNAFSTNNLLAERRFSLRLRSNTRPSWRRSSRTRQGKCTGENECACVCACFRVFFCGHIFRLLQVSQMIAILREFRSRKLGTGEPIYVESLANKLEFSLESTKRCLEQIGLKLAKHGRWLAVTVPADDVLDRKLAQMGQDVSLANRSVRG